jgi:hypothetical protein
MQGKHAEKKENSMSVNECQNKKEACSEGQECSSLDNNYKGTRSPSEVLVERKGETVWNQETGS